MQDSIVVCRQLGLVSVGVEAAGFGQGTGRIWLDNVQCTGSEEELVMCRASSSGVNSCSHSQDAGVRCGNSVILWSIFMHACRNLSRMSWRKCQAAWWHFDE